MGKPVDIIFVQELVAFLAVLNVGVLLSTEVLVSLALSLVVEPFVLAIYKELLVLAQELPEGTLADKADAGGILLGKVRQTGLLGQLSHGGLLQVSQRKQHARQLRLGEPMQKIALVLCRVRCAEQFEAAIARGMTAVLASPRFLFREEFTDPRSAPDQHPFLDDHSLASRLSYFLWSSQPDAELRALADRGELRRQLPAQLKRMLADSKAEALTKNFVGQWLDLRKIDFTIPDPVLYSDFDPLLRALSPYYVQNIEVAEPTLEEIFLSYYGANGQSRKEKAS